MSTPVAKPKEQYILRVRFNSELDRVMRALEESGKPLSETELVSIGGKKRSGWLIRFMANYFDNVHVSAHGDFSKPASLMHTMTYSPVIPTLPKTVGLDTATTPTAGAPQPALDDGMFEDIRWPQAPPLIESMGDKFRQPHWYNTMRSMVYNGSHIALSGPPGVGKDTAVQQLAADEGRILVTVGGDAGFRRRDLTGQVHIDRGRSYIEVAEYAAAVVYGWWALITEVNAADADALMFLNAQMAPPYIISIGGKAYPVHPNFRLFVSYNPGLVGTKPLPQSFKDRFFSIQVPFFNYNQLKALLVAHGMPDDAPWGSSIVNYGIKMWDAHSRGSIRYQITSRRLFDAVTLLMIGVTNSVNEALELGVLSSIDSPVEAKVAKQILMSM